MSSPWVAKSLTEVAAFFDVAVTTVRKDWRARGMPGEKGEYRLDEIARWRIQLERERAKPVAEDETAKELNRRQHVAQTEVIEAESQLKVIRLKRESGELVELVWMVGILQRALARFRQRVEAQPAEHAMLLPEEVRSEVIHEWEQANRLLLKELIDVSLAELWTAAAAGGDGESEE